ncbi:hypothetical protein [Aestuariirhabdus sp. LZHN29]|uniref:hypothetical protein n=1 Tax=Aestuariirhabdus sp. LZHN29 TaxID=3417462 RepID=UPI003CE7FA1B
MRGWLLVFAVLGLAGCSALAYTPVVGTTVVGADRESLNDQPEYREFIEAPLALVPTPDREWSLRRFNGGRYFVELSGYSNQSTERICMLGDGDLVIEEIFQDRINGGVHYQGRARCGATGGWIKVPRNHWYPEGFAPVVE